EPRLHDPSGRQMAAAGHVELPAVPRAGHCAAVERSFSQRPALVRTNAVEREEAAVHIVKSHDALIDHEFVHAARWTVRPACYSLPVSHAGRPHRERSSPGKSLRGVRKSIRHYRAGKLRPPVRALSRFAAGDCLSSAGAPTSTARVLDESYAPTA